MLVIVGGTEVGSVGTERDLEHSLERVEGILGLVPTCTLSPMTCSPQLIAERRKDTVRARKDENGAQLWRPISNKRVNKTTTGLLRRASCSRDRQLGRRGPEATKVEEAPAQRNQAPIWEIRALA